MINTTHLLEAVFLFFSYEDNDEVFHDLDIKSETTPIEILCNKFHDIKLAILNGIFLYKNYIILIIPQLLPPHQTTFLQQKYKDT